MGYNVPLGGISRTVKPGLVIHSAPFKRIEKLNVGARTTLVNLGESEQGKVRVLAYCVCPYGPEMEQALWKMYEDVKGPVKSLAGAGEEQERGEEGEEGVEGDEADNTPVEKIAEALEELQVENAGSEAEEPKEETEVAEGAEGETAETAESEETTEKAETTEEPEKAETTEESQESTKESAESTEPTEPPKPETSKEQLNITDYIEVPYLVAGDLEHYMGVSSWLEVFPDAALVGPAELKSRRLDVKYAFGPQHGNRVIGRPVEGEGEGEEGKEEEEEEEEETAEAEEAEETAKSTASEVSATPQVSTLSQPQTSAAPQFPPDAAAAEDIGLPEELTNVFEFIYFPYHRNKELVLFHKPTKALLEADLMFNMPPTEQYAGTGVDPTKGWSKLVKNWNPYTKTSRFLVKRLFTDKQLTTAGLEALYAWDVEIIIPCHGDVITRNPKLAIKSLFRDFLI